MKQIRNGRLTENQLGYFAGIDEWIRWMEFEKNKIDVITRENKKAEKVRFIFFKDMDDKLLELRRNMKEERLRCRKQEQGEQA